VETRPALPESASAEAARLLYRIVRTDPPTAADFTSNHALGKVPRRPEPEVVRLWDGLSMYETEQQARVKATLRPALGRYIAAVAVMPAVGVRIERTTSSAGHHTVWGEAPRLLALVQRVIAV